MSEIINTPNGDYEFEPIALFHGRKKIDRQLARRNLLAIGPVLGALGIRWGIIYGTLLGAVREGDFIEHDEDTDIFVFDEDKERVLSMLHEIKALGFTVARYEPSLLSIIRDNEYIDFYFFKKKFRGRRAGAYFVPAEFFSGFDSIKFLGVDFPTVCFYEQFLAYVYGNSWRTPVEDAHAQPKPVFWKALILNVLSFLRKYS